jgi:hypothetical protein
MIITPIKMMLGFAGIATLSAIVAIQHIPAPAAPIAVAATPDAAWSESFQTAVEKRQDRIRQIEIARPEPVPVVTERIVPDSPALPPIITTGEEAPKRKQRHAAVDVCTRHHMRKVVTRGGRSWKCRK